MNPVSFQFDRVSQIVKVDLPKDPKIFSDIKNPFGRMEWNELRPVKLIRCQVNYFYTDQSAIIENCAINIIHAQGNIFLRDCKTMGQIFSESDVCILECGNLDFVEGKELFYEMGSKSEKLHTFNVERYRIFYECNRLANRGSRILLEENGPLGCHIQ